MTSGEVERGLTARSVVASLLLASEPPWLPTPVLIRGTALFGIAEGATRTALSRMAAAGETVAEGTGYRLRGGLLDRHARQRMSRLAEMESWNGTWRMAVVVGGARTAADRAGLRTAMKTLRLAELHDGVWLRPDNLLGRPSGEAALVVAEQCRWLSANPDDDPVTLAAELWDLGAWSRRARTLLVRLSEGQQELEAGGPQALTSGFLASAAVLRHLQADPLLPPQLLPDDWPGTSLRQRYDAFDRVLRAVLTARLREAE